MTVGYVKPAPTRLPFDSFIAHRLSIYHRRLRRAGCRGRLHRSSEQHTQLSCCSGVLRAVHVIAGVGNGVVTGVCTIALPSPVPSMSPRPRWCPRILQALRCTAYMRDSAVRQERCSSVAHMRPHGTGPMHHATRASRRPMSCSSCAILASGADCSSCEPVTSPPVAIPVPPAMLSRRAVSAARRVSIR